MINLSFLIAKPTGITNYAINLLPHLKSLDPVLFSHREFSDFRCHPISDQLTPEQGKKGHLGRLVWTQFQCPQIYHRYEGNLLFCPLPEAPLFSRCRFVVTLHDLIPCHFPNWRKNSTYYHLIYIPQVLHQAEHILCDSQATADDAMARHQISARKLSVVPLACDTDHFRFLDLPMQNYFLYVGRDDPHKNLPRMIQALAQLNRNGLACELWLVGGLNPRNQQTITRLTSDLGLISQVKLLNYVPYDQLPVLINQAIGLLMPSLWEGFGLPVLEGMACGTPVITSNLSSLPEVAGEAALLVDPYQVDSIAAAMERLVRDGDLRRHLRELGWARVRQFSWLKTGQMTSKILSLFL